VPTLALRAASAMAGFGSATRALIGIGPCLRERGSGDEAFRLASEVAGAGERAEEVRGALVEETPGRAVGVGSHPADRIDRELPLCGLASADCREDLDRFANVAQQPRDS